MASASSVPYRDAAQTVDSDDDDDDSYNDDSDDHDTSSDDWYPPEGFGLLPYQYEPKYTEEELRQRDLEAQRAAEEQRRGTRSQTTRRKVWCGCGNCEIMDTAAECRCCREIEKTDMIRKSTDPQPPCITLHPGFGPVCLNLHVLQTSYFAYRQQFGHDSHSDQVHKRYIGTAKRQLLLWCDTFVGKAVKKPLPACALVKIRRQFPREEDATFTYPSMND